MAWISSGLSAVGGGQALLVGLGEGGVGQLLHRGGVDAAVGRGGGQRFDLRQQGGHQRLRLHYALPHALAHVDDGLVDPARQLLQAAQVGLVFLHGADRLRAFAAGQVGQHHRHAAHLLQRQQVVGEGRQRQQRFQFEVQDVVADAVFAAQLRARNGLQALGVLAVQRELPLAPLRRDGYADLVIVAVVAAGGGVHRIEARHGVVIFVGQGQQAFLRWACCAGCCGDCGCVGIVCQRRRGEQHGDSQCCGLDAEFHVRRFLGWVGWES